MSAHAEAPPLSVAQEALWYQSLLAPKQVSYNEAISIRKDGPLELEALRQAFNEIVGRHEAWRTTFDLRDGEPVQIIHPVAHFDLPLVDLSHLGAEAAEEQAARIVADVSSVPYDLRNGPLLRPRLFRFPGEHHRLYLAMHHIIFDGVSVYRVVLGELVALYDAAVAGRRAELELPPAQYCDYARWEQGWMGEPRVARRVERWREHLAQLPALELPFDHPRPPDRQFRGGIVPLSLPSETVDGLRALGRSTGATLFQVLATVWALLLGHYSGAETVVFATAADLRRRAEFESVVGYCLTPLVLRVQLAGDPTLRELILGVRNELLDALDRLVPFERLVRELQPRGPGNANPIYQTMLVLEPLMETPDPAWSVHQMESGVGAVVGSAKLDLELELDERPEGGIEGRLIYDSDLFDATTAQRITAHWLALASAAPTAGETTASVIPLLSAEEAHRQLVQWNATATSGPRETIDALVRLQCRRTPDAPALSDGTRTFSYADLNRASDALAASLRSYSDPGSSSQPIAILAPPSFELAAGALAALKAGKPYLLLDPGLPRARLETLLTESAASALMLGPGLEHAAVPAHPQCLPIDLNAQSPVGVTSEGARDDEAIASLTYVPLSGGSTTSLETRHGAIVNLAHALAGELGIERGDTVLSLPAPVFADPTLELWMPLLAGARILFAPVRAAAGGAEVDRLIAEQDVTLLHAAPSAWRGLIDSGLQGRRGLRALSGGECLSSELASEILERCRVLWNAYGAAETAGYCMLARVRADSPVTIGRPLANTRAYVVDAAERPAAIGVAGELLLAGASVADAYGGVAVDDSTLGPDPFAPGRVFRTGARARWLAGGEVQLLAAATVETTSRGADERRESQPLRPRSSRNPPPRAASATTARSATYSP
ncbi:MAG TPA: condensation domain-containing protein [Solirubrobacteraceae bacterium]